MNEPDVFNYLRNIPENPKVIVPRLVRKMKLPRHTYKVAKFDFTEDDWEGLIRFSHDNGMPVRYFLTKRKFQIQIPCG